MREQWKRVKNFDAQYEVSNMGKVRSLFRTEDTVGRFGTMKRKRAGRVLKHNIRNGYASVELNRNGIPCRTSVHRLVCSAFIRDLKRNEVVHHIDENKTNNCVWNLQILTYSEHNRLHPRRIWNKGMKGYMSGKRDPKTYETRRKKVICVETGTIYNSVSSAAKHIGKKANTVTAALKNSQRTAGGFHFGYYR